MAPHSVADFAEAFAAVCRSGAAGLRVVGAATKLRGASIAPEAVSTRNLAALPDYRPADLTLTAQAGAPIAELRRVAERDNLALPIDAADFDGQATLGGVVADNDVGPCGLALGMPRDAVLGATVVLGDGTLVRSGGRVLKNSAGYALHRLLAGSRGQLAALVELTVRLRPRPAAFRVVRTTLSDEREAEGCTAALLSGDTRPALLTWRAGERSVELYVGYADHAAAVEWQLAAALRRLPGAVAADEAESRRTLAELTRFGESADFVAALRGSRTAALFSAARELGVSIVAHAAGGRVLARGAGEDSLAGLAAIVSRLEGRVVAPGRLARPDGSCVRAALRSAMRAEAAP